METLSPSFPSPLNLQDKGASPSPRPSALAQEGAGLRHPCVCVGGGGIVPCPDPTPNFSPFPAALPPAWHYETGRPVTMVTIAWLLVGGGAQGGFSQSAH